MKSSLWTLCFLVLPLPTSSFNTLLCGESLGFESEMLVRKRFPGTLYSVDISYQPNIRDHVLTEGSTWCQSSSPTTNTGEWLQVDFGTEHVITILQTHGVYDDGRMVKNLEPYEVHYWRPEVNSWIQYRDRHSNHLLIGNLETYTGSKTVLHPSIIASKLRFVVHFSPPRTVCMRVEAYGCSFQEILSYSMPQGTEDGSISYLDYLYDGLVEGNILKNGLGQLTDGEEGFKDFKKDLRYPTRERGWVGWRKKEGSEINNSVQIVFKFKETRQFVAVHINVCNQFHSGIKMFREARAEFSEDNETYKNEAIQTVEEDTDSEIPRNITMQLQMRSGLFVRLSFYFASDWILISEIYFESYSIERNEREESINPIHKIYFPPRNPDDHGTTGNDDKLTEDSEWMPKYSIIITATAVGVVLFIPVCFFVARKWRMSSRREESNRTVVQYASNHSRRLGEEVSSHGTELVTYPPTSPPPVHFYTNPLGLSTEPTTFPSGSPLYNLNSLPCSSKMTLNEKNILLEQEFNRLNLTRIHMKDMKVLEILANGNFGTLTGSRVKVNVKSLNSNATIEDKREFIKQVKDIYLLREPHLAQLLGVCFEGQAVGAVVEFMELGNLRQFLRHYGFPNPHSAYKQFETKDLLYICCQLSSGMEFLAKQNIIHKDLAARNCIIGDGLKVKVSYFAKDLNMFAKNYCEIGFGTPVPLRWMAYESVCTGFYSTKTDVWSFGMTMWEILLHCQHDPYPSMDDASVLRYLRQFEIDECSHVSSSLPKPAGINYEIYNLMCSMWKKNLKERPNFREIRSTLFSGGLSMSSRQLGLSTSELLPYNIANIYENPSPVE